MRYGCTLETVNVKASGPNAFLAQSKTYWTDILKYMAAAGFQSLEMPYSPYTADPLAFETGRAGNPISKFAVDSQYGGAAEFLKLLDGFGIKEVSGLHISATDTMLDIVARFASPESLFDEFEKLAEEAVAYAGELKAPAVVLSPSIEAGLAEKYFLDVDEYRSKTAEMVKRICRNARKQGVTPAVKNEFWSVFRGAEADALLDAVEDAFFSPDTAHLRIAGYGFSSAVTKWAGRILLPRFSDTDFVDTAENYKKIHAESPREGAQRVFCDMGDGCVDFEAAARALADAGYDGVVVCDCKKTTDALKALLKMGWMAKRDMKAEGA